MRLIPSHTFHDEARKQGDDIACSFEQVESDTFRRIMDGLLALAGDAERFAFLTVEWMEDDPEETRTDCVNRVELIHAMLNLRPHFHYDIPCDIPPLPKKKGKK